MIGRAASIALAALSASCVHQTVARHAAQPAPTVWERQVRNAHDAGDGDYELRTLRDKVASEPSNISARLDLAAAYRDRGYREVALEICRLATERFPNSAAAHSWVGLLLDETRHPAEAEGAHRKAVSLAPGADYLHNNLGYNLLQQNKNLEAAAEFREALRLNPLSQLARNNLGLALAHTEAAAEAIAVWQQGSDPATAHNNLAAVWIEKGNFAAARKELEIALGYNKTFPAAINNLELVSRQDGVPGMFHVKQDQTRWARWKSGFMRLWVGPLDGPRQETAVTAGSVPATGEER